MESTSNFNRIYVALLITVLASSISIGQQAVRIGLRTGQNEIRIQSAVPVQVLQDEKPLLDIPAEQILVFRKKDAGITISDNDDKPLLTLGKAVQIKPAPLPPAEQTDKPAASTTEQPIPLIRLLGATTHYDGKADRPYRGYFTILPNAKGLTVINVVDLEEYLYGVIPSEMAPRYPLEALKAQAIAARTYAVKNLGAKSSEGFDMDDTARFQVYGGYLSEDPRTTEAVNCTAGMVLTYKNELISAVYSSTCGGFTESAESAWGKAVPYLVSQADCSEDDSHVCHPKNESEWSDYFKASSQHNCCQPKFARLEAFRWVKIFSRTELEAGLPEKYKVGTLQAIIPLKRGPSGRITELRLDGSQRTVTIKSELSIRNALGKLNSSAFTVESYSDDKGIPAVFTFWGAGWGHGIGMCQVGAVGMADKGMTYDKILTYYYQGASIEKR